jgi:hypothetical protein
VAGEVGSSKTPKCLVEPPQEALAGFEVLEHIDEVAIDAEPTP